MVLCFMDHSNRKLVGTPNSNIGDVHSDFPVRIYLDVGRFVGLDVVGRTRPNEAEADLVSKRQGQGTAVELGSNA